MRQQHPKALFGRGRRRCMSLQNTSPEWAVGLAEDSVTEPNGTRRGQKNGGGAWGVPYPWPRVDLTASAEVMFAPADKVAGQRGSEGSKSRNSPGDTSRGGATTGPDATPPPPPRYLSKLGGGAVGAGGGSAGGGGGGLRATHYYHMHTSRGGVCLGAWGYRGMYAIIAISCLCREESLKGLQDQRHSTPLQLSMRQKIWRHGPRTAMFQKPGGGCRIQEPGPAAPPPGDTLG